VSIHLGAALDVLPKERVQVFLREVAYIDGRWQGAGEPLLHDFMAVVQTATPRDLRHLPEGSEAQDAIVIHSPVELRTVSESEQAVADELEVGARGHYRVMSVGDWRRQGFNRYVAGSIQ
jgi:hypothetical protein